MIPRAMRREISLLNFAKSFLNSLISWRKEISSSMAGFPDGLGVGKLGFLGGILIAVCIIGGSLLMEPNRVRKLTPVLKAKFCLLDSGIPHSILAESAVDISRVTHRCRTGNL